MKRIVWACCLNGILFGAVKLFYELSPMPLSGLLYCTMLGFTATLAVGAKVRLLPSYLGCVGIGVLWVLGYLLFESLALYLPFSQTLCKVLAFGLMSFTIEAANILWLRKTALGLATIQFASVIGVFSQGCTNIPWVIVALIIGIIAAVISKSIYEVTLKVSTNSSTHINI